MTEEGVEVEVIERATLELYVAAKHVVRCYHLMMQV
jgi:hypothetical protein